MAQTIDKTGSRPLVRSTSTRRTETRHAIVRARQWAIALALAFAAVAALVAAGATDAIDQRVSAIAGAAGSEAIDLPASIFNVVGQMEVTGVVALALAFVWWRRRGARGLVPLLLFAGVALEVVLKHVVQHPGVPEEMSRGVQLLPFGHAATPYSFPSGHMLRVTFLAALTTHRWAFWALVILMAATRLYLNEHWASDVLGGFLLGAALAAVAASLYADPDA
jgi:undecaprenyl-diphosphatase